MKQLRQHLTAELAGEEVQGDRSGLEGNRYLGNTNKPGGNINKPASLTTGTTVFMADPCKDNTLAKNRSIYGKLF